MCVFTRVTCVRARMCVIRVRAGFSVCMCVCMCVHLGVFWPLSLSLVSILSTFRVVHTSTCIVGALHMNKHDGGGVVFQPPQPSFRAMHLSYTGFYLGRRINLVC